MQNLMYVSFRIKIIWLSAQVYYLISFYNQYKKVRLGAFEPNLTLFYQKKITSTKILHRSTPFFGNPATPLRKNYQLAGQLRELK